MAVVFLILLGWASYDIASRTTFPGSKPQLKSRIKEKYIENPENVGDTIVDNNDSTR